MITLEFGIKNTKKTKKKNHKKKQKKIIWFSTLAKHIALHCNFKCHVLYECRVGLSSLVSGPTGTFTR